MFDLTGFGRRVCFGLKTPQCAAIVVAAMAAGCSADVTRFDSASFNLNDPPEAAAAVPQEPVRGHSDYANPVANSTPRGPYGAGAGSVDVAALPEPTQPEPVARPYTDASWKRTPTAPAQAAPSYAQNGASNSIASNTSAPSASGQTVEVQPGDTLYGLSKRHGVALSALMSANGLSSPNLKPGQKLIVPSADAPIHSARRAPHTTPSAAPPSPEVASRYGSTYTVQPGDSLYKIARANKVNFAELQQVNGITDVRKVRPGTVLKIPGASSVAAPAASTPTLPPAAVAEAAPSASPRMADATTTQPTVINAGKQVAALNESASDASSAQAPAAEPAPKADKVANAAPQSQAQAGDSSKLRWPVSGRVISGFGGRPDGTHNDGINMSVPLGTDVHAAEAGVVAYSGSELKGYGNLVLIRHDNGWVTAYAHNDELLVKRGDKVRRGQVIGKAGKTGTVDQPQVHFELRQGSKPVDPTPFMEKL